VVLVLKSEVGIFKEHSLISTKKSQQFENMVLKYTNYEFQINILNNTLLMKKEVRILDESPCI